MDVYRVLVYNIESCIVWAFSYSKDMTIKKKKNNKNKKEKGRKERLSLDYLVIGSFNVPFKIKFQAFPTTRHN